MLPRIPSEDYFLPRWLSMFTVRKEVHDMFPALVATVLATLAFWPYADPSVNVSNTLLEGMPIADAFTSDANTGICLMSIALAIPFAIDVVLDVALKPKATKTSKPKAGELEYLSLLESVLLFAGFTVGPILSLTFDDVTRGAGLVGYATSRFQPIALVGAMAASFTRIDPDFFPRWWFYTFMITWAVGVHVITAKYVYPARYQTSDAVVTASNVLSYGGIALFFAAMVNWFVRKGRELARSFTRTSPGGAGDGGDVSAPASAAGKMWFPIAYTGTCFVCVLIGLVAFLISGDAALFTPKNSILANTGVVVLEVGLLVFFLRAVKFQAMDDFKVSIASRKAYLRYVAHELRTPLSSASLGMSWLINTLSAIEDRDELDDDLLETCNDVSKTLQVAVSIMSDLMTVNKIECGMFALHKQDVNIKGYVADCVASFNAEAREKGIKILVMGLADVPPHHGSVNRNKQFNARDLLRKAASGFMLDSGPRRAVAPAAGPVAAGGAAIAIAPGAADVEVPPMAVPPAAAAGPSSAPGTGRKRSSLVQLLSPGRGSPRRDDLALAVFPVFKDGLELQDWDTFSVDKFKVRRFWPRGLRHRCSLLTQCRPILWNPCVVQMDQVLRNLLSNALKFSAKNGVVCIKAGFRPAPKPAPVHPSSRGGSLSRKMSAIPGMHFRSLIMALAPGSGHFRPFNSQKMVDDTAAASPTSPKHVTQRRVSAHAKSVFRHASADKVANAPAANPDEVPGELVVVVRDEGCGISKENQQLLFLEGKELDPGKLQTGGGSGFGLFISKSIVEMHGGTIEVRSNGEGQGATFIYRIPMTRSAEPKAPPAAARRSLVGSPIGRAGSSLSAKRAASRTNMPHAAEGPSPRQQAPVAQEAVVANDGPPVPRRLSASAGPPPTKPKYAGTRRSSDMGGDMGAPRTPRGATPRLPRPILEPRPNIVAEVDLQAVLPHLLFSPRPLPKIDDRGEDDDGSSSSSSSSSDDEREPEPEPEPEAGPKVTAAASNRPSVDNETTTDPRDAAPGGAKVPETKTKAHVGVPMLNLKLAQAGEPKADMTAAASPNGGGHAGKTSGLACVGESGSGSGSRHTHVHIPLLMLPTQGVAPAADSASTVGVGTFVELRMAESSSPGPAKGGSGPSAKRGSVKSMVSTDSEAKHAAGGGSVSSGGPRRTPTRAGVTKRSFTVAEVDASKPKYHILIVEDSAMARKMLNKTLKADGHTTEEAEDGTIGVDKVRQKVAAGGKYDAILMDFVMPNMDGPTATKAIRTLGYKGPIIACTGNTLDIDVQRFKEAGCYHIIGKPFVLTTFQLYMTEIQVLGDAYLKDFVGATTSTNK